MIVSPFHDHTWVLRHHGVRGEDVAAEYLGCCYDEAIRGIGVNRRQHFGCMGDGEGDRFANNGMLNEALMKPSPRARSVRGWRSCPYAPTGEPPSR
jgi:hypothetical protein